MGLLNNFKLGRENEHEVNLHVEIRAGIRRIRATWTPELVQNIEAYHNINAEEELTRLLSQELSRQIDEDIIRTLTVANDLVAVQPMGTPTGRLFYFDYRYDINDFKFGR
jgi:hypothetical protein